MQYVVYLKMPEYTKEYVLHNFSKDGKVAKCNHLSFMEGFLQSRLKRRLDFYPEEEKGNLALEIPNVCASKKKECYNYLSNRDRYKLSNMFKNIMLSDFWSYMLPHIRASKTETRKKNKINGLVGFITEFCEDNGISITHDSINRFIVETHRLRKSMKDFYGIEI